MPVIGDKPKLPPQQPLKTEPQLPPTPPLTVGAPVVTKTAPPPVPAAVFEKTQTPPPGTQQPLSTADSTPAVDVGAAVKEHIAPLAEAVVAGPQPSARPAAPGALEDPEPTKDGVPFGVVLANLTAELRQESVHLDNNEALAETVAAVLTPPPEVVPSPAKPLPPAVVAQVATALRQTGDILIPKGSTEKVPEAHEGIEIPGPVVVAMEKAVKENIGGFDFSTMDVETLAMIVMFEASKGAKADLRDAISEINDTRKKKDAMRARMAEIREDRARVENQMRQEYNARRALPPDDPDFIPASVTFETYKEDRQISIARDGEGAPTSGTALLGDGPEYPPDPPATTTTGGPAGANTDNSPSDPKNLPPVNPATDWAGIPDDVKAIAQKYNLPANHARAALEAFNALGSSGMLEVMFDGKTPTFEQFLQRAEEVEVQIDIGPFSIPVRGKPGETKTIMGTTVTFPKDGGMLPGGDARNNALGLAAMLQKIQSTYLNPDWVEKLATGNPPGSGGMYQNVAWSQMFLDFEDGNVDPVVKARLQQIASEQMEKFQRLKNAGNKLFGDQWSAKLARDMGAVATKTRDSLKRSVANWQSWQRDDIPRDWNKIMRDDGFRWHDDNRTGVSNYPEYMKAMAPLCQAAGLTVDQMIGMFDTDSADRKRGDSVLANLIVSAIDEENGLKNGSNAGAIGDVKKALDASMATLRARTVKLEVASLVDLQPLQVGARQTGGLRMIDTGGIHPGHDGDGDGIDDPGTGRPGGGLGGGGGGVTPPPKPPKPNIDLANVGVLEVAPSPKQPEPPKEPDSPKQPDPVVDPSPKPPVQAQPDAASQPSPGALRQGSTLADLDNALSTMRDQMDSLGELGQSQQMRLQIYMDNLTGLQQTLSNMLKKWSDTSGAIMANMK